MSKFLDVLKFIGRFTLVVYFTPIFLPLAGLWILWCEIVHQRIQNIPRISQHFSPCEKCWEKDNEWMFFTSAIIGVFIVPMILIIWLSR